MTIEVSSPGKLVILGEYAVLEGAPALVMAVNRRARARIEPIRRERSVLEAPDVVSHVLEFSCDDHGTLQWLQIDGKDRDRLDLFAQILGTLSEYSLFAYSEVAPFKVSLDTAQFFHRSRGRTRKLGLGSSAALTVALSTALAAYGQRAPQSPDHPNWLAELLSIHQRFQQGSGSGLDVAASWKGGLISYRLAGGMKRGAPVPEVRPMRLPRDIGFLGIWSGTAASTPGSIRRFIQWQRNDPEVADIQMRRLGAISESGIRATGAGDTVAFMEAVAAYGRALRTLDEQCKLNIYTEAHRHVDKLASALGLVYKPCGAGGGDTGIAFSADPERLQALAARLDVTTVRPFGLQIDPTGLRLDVRDPAPAG